MGMQNAKEFCHCKYCEAAHQRRFGKPAAAVEAYDLAGDPTETRPLAATDGRASACLGELDRWVARARTATPRREGKGVQMTPEELERLRTLGYLR